MSSPLSRLCTRIVSPSPICALPRVVPCPCVISTPSWNPTPTKKSKIFISKGTAFAVPFSCVKNFQTQFVVDLPYAAIVGGGDSTPRGAPPLQPPPSQNLRQEKGKLDFVSHFSPPQTTRLHTPHAYFQSITFFLRENVLPFFINRCTFACNKWTFPHYW